MSIPLIMMKGKRNQKRLKCNTDFLILSKTEQPGNL